MLNRLGHKRDKHEAPDVNVCKCPIGCKLIFSVKNASKIQFMLYDVVSAFFFSDHRYDETNETFFFVNFSGLTTD